MKIFHGFFRTVYLCLKSITVSFVSGYYLLLFWFRRLVWACLSVFYVSLRFFFQLYCHFFPIEQCIKFESQSVRRNEVRKITAQIVI